MSKFRNVFGAVLRGSVVVMHSVAAILIPTKFADAATRDDGAHKDRVASDEGLRFQLDAKADEALARSEAYVQVAQANPRGAQDVVQDAVQALSQQGVDVGALLQAGQLGNVIQSMVESGAVEGADTGGDDAVDIEDVVEDLSVDDVEELAEGS